MRTDFYCLDADNKVFIAPEREYVMVAPPNTAYHPVALSEKKLENGQSELSVEVWHGCIVSEKVFESSLIVDSALDDLQRQQLANAWTVCYYMSGYYRKRLFHRLFFSLVLRDPVIRDIFQHWISQSQQNHHIVVPNLVAAGPTTLLTINQ